MFTVHRNGPAVANGKTADSGRSARLPRVLCYTSPTAMQDAGGGEVQLLKTAEYLQRLGVDARPLDPWHDRLNRVDWLHLFGTHPDCLAMARVAKRLGTSIALSPISWYDPRVNWSLEPTWGRRFRALSTWMVRRVWPDMPSWRRELIALADVLLPNSEAEAEQLEQLFGVPNSKIVVVPNGVDERFESGNANLFVDQFGVSDFVLMPGRIEPRKNQLAVIRALWGSGIPLVVLGDPQIDHAGYHAECLRVADPGVTFVGRIEHESPLLASAYAAARVVVLASWFETPGLAALEGALAGASVVVTERGCTREYFGDAVDYVQPNDLNGIRAAIRRAMMRKFDPSLREHVKSRFLWQHTAARTLAAYSGEPVSEVVASLAQRRAA